MCGGNVSYGWRSIQAGKELLQQGLRIRLGDGRSTHVWFDQWLPTSPPRPANGMILDPSLKVSDMWMENRREWDTGKLNHYLSEEDANLAQQLLLSTHAPYTVRSGYWFSTHISPQDEDIAPPLGSLDIKMEIWSLKILPKIQHFLWRALSNALPTADRLRTRKINISPVCQRCCCEDETINHVIFEGNHARAIWRCANIPTFDHDNISASFEENIRMLLSIKENMEIPLHLRLLPFFMVWMIWKSRNEFIFRKMNVHQQEDVNRGYHSVREWIAAQEETLPNGQQPQINFEGRNSQWEAPPEGWLKCNFDSSFRNDQEITGIGWIVRDHLGKHILSGCSKLRRVNSALQAETIGFLHVLQIVWAKGWRNVWFEGDT